MELPPRAVWCEQLLANRATGCQEVGEAMGGVREQRNALESLTWSGAGWDRYPYLYANLEIEAVIDSLQFGHGPPN